MPYLLKTLTPYEFNQLNMDNYENIDPDYTDNVYIKELKNFSHTTSKIKTRSKLSEYENIDEYIIKYDSNSSSSDKETIYQILTNRNKIILKRDFEQMKYEYIKMLENTSIDDDTFLELYINLVKEKCDPSVWSLQIYGTEVGSGTVETDVITKEEGNVHIFAKTYISTKDDYSSVNSTNPVWSHDIYEIYKLCSYKLNIRYLMDGIIPENSKTGILISVLEQHKEEKQANKEVEVIILRGIRVTKLRGIDKNPLGVYMCSSRMGKFLQQHTENIICSIKQYINEPKKQRKSKEGLSKFVSMPEFYELYAIEDAVGFWEHVGFTKTRNQKIDDKEPRQFKTKVIGNKTTYHMTKPICSM